MGDALQDLINKVVQWGHDRNLNAPDNLKAQTMKLVSEFGEIGAGIDQYNTFDVIDGIGDTIVVAIIIGQQIGFPVVSQDLKSSGIASDSDYYRATGLLGQFVDYVLKGHDAKDQNLQLKYFIGAVCDVALQRRIGVYEALLAAYNEIKDRKGVMYQGAFIKEADPRYPEVMQELGRA